MLLPSNDITKAYNGMSDENGSWDGLLAKTQHPAKQCGGNPKQKSTPWLGIMV